MASSMFESPIPPSDTIPSEEMILQRFRKTLQLIRAEHCLAKACTSVEVLNDQIRGLTSRYDNTVAQKSLRYSVRIRLAVAEGVRDMFYEYARQQAEDVAELRKELYNQSVEIVSGRDGSSDDDEEEDDDLDEDDRFGR